MIKIIALPLFLSVILLSCCHSPVKDVVKSPASLNQMRLVMNIDGQKEVGIYGTTDPKVLKIQTITSGTISVRGFKDCGYIDSPSYKDTDWYSIDLYSLPDFPACRYNIQVKSNDLDAPAIGTVLIKTFDDPNIEPLKLSVNKRDFKGVAWAQLKEDDREEALPESKSALLKIKADVPELFALDIDVLINSMEKAGIKGVLSDTAVFTTKAIMEGRDIILYPKGTIGKIIISGCNMKTPLIEDFDLSNSNAGWKTSLDYLYSTFGGVYKSCIFDIIVNNDDYYNKENAMLYINLYKEGGSFLSAPVVYKSGKEMCFEFQDKYVVAVRVNSTSTGRWNTASLCVDKANQYEITAITSNMRTFYGIHDGTKWLFEK